MLQGYAFIEYLPSSKLGSQSLGPALKTFTLAFLSLGSATQIWATDLPILGRDNSSLFKKSQTVKKKKKNLKVFFLDIWELVKGCREIQTLNLLQLFSSQGLTLEAEPSRLNLDNQIHNYIISC